MSFPHRYRVLTVALVATTIGLAGSIWIGPLFWVATVALVVSIVLTAHMLRREFSNLDTLR